MVTDSLPETAVVPVPPAARRRRSFSVRFSEALSRLLVRLKVDEVPHIKRIIVTTVGGTILVFGFALIWAPAPTSLLIPLGLAVLGTEYAWALDAQSQADGRQGARQDAADHRRQGPGGLISWSGHASGRS